MVIYYSKVHPPYYLKKESTGMAPKEVLCKVGLAYEALLLRHNFQ